MIINDKITHINPDITDARSAQLTISQLHPLVNTLYQKDLMQVEEAYPYYFMKHPEVIKPQNTSHYFLESKDLSNLRKDFPIFNNPIHGHPLIWFDNAATTQKPNCVIDTINHFYREANSNVHRGAHTLAKITTTAYETAREKIQKFIGAAHLEEIIFVRGATEGINLIANTFGHSKLQAGDEILITALEHHSNIVPWQLLKKAKGIVLKQIPINDQGEIDLEAYQKLFNSKTRLVALNHISNVLGTINPVQRMIEIAHKHGAYALVDGAQAAPHLPINVTTLDADFYVFSGHKVYGPTGIGILYGKKTLLEEMPPWQGGGGMIQSVDFEETTYNALPHKFEAGTGSIADAIALGSAVNYLQGIGMDRIFQHEMALTHYAMQVLSEIKEVTLIGTAKEKTSVISFVTQALSPQNIATQLDKVGIAVRAGHHCAQPTLQRFGIDSTLRISLGVYNTLEEIDYFVKALQQIIKK